MDTNERSCSEEEQPSLEQVELVWRSELTLYEARFLGAFAPPRSCVLKPRPPPLLWAKVLRQIPEDIFPRVEDSVQSLLLRLSASEFLDDAMVLRGGCGPDYVRLNATDYPQPRRALWGAIDPESGGMFVYPHLYRKDKTLQCRPLRGVLRAFVDHLQSLTGQHLEEVCARLPINSCELLMY